MDLLTLQEATRRGERFKYLFFWGHQPQADGSIGKGCLSQWWPAAFAIDGVRYLTAEHYMMAEKARLFDDQTALERILSCEHPAEAKKLGRGVKNFEAARWDQKRFEIVVTGSQAKFAADPELSAFLLGTGQRVLVEASPRDRIWGIGMGARNEHAENPLKWRGKNLLGFALMEARRRLAR